MIPLHVDQIETVLCLGAHADDIEIGCGGTLLELLSARPTLRVHWIVLSGEGPRAGEAVRSAQRFLQRAGEKEIRVERFRDSYFPYDGPAIKQYFQELPRNLAPDLIFTHRREDLHQDHRLVAELTWNAFRNHLIFEYEIPKYEGDLAAPNVLMPLSEAACRRKVETIIDCFPSQHNKPWFSPDTLWALLRLRGLECNSPTRYAEGLYCRKAVFTAAPAVRLDEQSVETETVICAPATGIDPSLPDAVPVAE